MSSGPKLMKVSCQYCTNHFYSPVSVQFDTEESRSDDALYCSDVCADKANGRW